MNGVSHMLPFVIGGGILIAVAFLLDDYSLNPANFGSNLPQAAFFKAIGDAAFGFMLPILLVSSRWRSETARRWQSVLSAA